MNLKVIDRKMGNPSKRKQSVPVAFSNDVHDFSGVYGGPVYTERPISYTFEILGADRTKLSVLEAKVLKWLMSPNQKTILIDDFVEGYYFEAEVEVQPDLDRLWRYGQLRVDFTAYPFKKSVLPEGHDIWDEIIFDLDVFQDVKFEINGQKEITLHNPGVPDVYPAIEASSAMQVQFKGKSHDIKAGTTVKADIPLSSGENELIVTGNGTIEFEFYKELI